jgi:hypothetical protein
MIKQRSSIMPPGLFDLLYGEYCRARLAEMRKQLWLWPDRRNAPQENCDADQLDSRERAGPHQYDLLKK